AEKEWTVDDKTYLPTWVVEKEHGIRHETLLDHTEGYSRARPSPFLAASYFHPKPFARRNRAGPRMATVTGWPKDEILEFAAARKRAPERANKFLRDALARAPVYGAEVIRSFRHKTGLDAQLLYRAKKELGVHTHQPTRTGRVWYREGQ